MGIVEGSITVSINSAGNYSVQLPKVGLDIIGFSVLGLNSSGPAFNGPPVVGVYLDASNIAYFPIIGNFFTMRKYTPVHIKLKGSVLNLNIPFASGNYSLGGLTIFYGKPSGDEIEIEDLKGVFFSVVNSSTTANTSGTFNISFPSGKVKIKGLFVLGLNNAIGQISFIAGTGETLYVPINPALDVADFKDNTYALDLESATSLPINYNLSYNSSGNSTLIGIAYYE